MPLKPASRSAIIAAARRSGVLRRIEAERNERLAKSAGARSKEKAPCCEDCYFRKNLLCALDLGPCATFRPDRPEGLVPPRQPVLLMRPPRWADRVGAAQPAAKLGGV